jgi:hypothetical protein
MVMLKMPTIVLGVFVAMILGGSARAGTPIEFQFSGVFTQVESGAAHTVGDPFTSTITFDPDALDTNISPLFGEYPFISWAVPRSRSTSQAVFQGPMEGEILVDIGGQNAWRVDRVQGLDTLFALVVTYPNGTFTSDRLPLSLSLANAIGDRLEVTEQGITVMGDITSISVREVPEPFGVGVLLLGLLMRRVARP